MMQINKLKKFADELISNTQGIYLNDEEVSKVQNFVLESKDFLKTLDFENQKYLLEICMKNFGLFVTFLKNLDSIPDSIKYALISKAMYSFGTCGTPSSVFGLEDLMNSVTHSWWDEIEDSSYNLREQVMQDPQIGIEPIADEFPTCGDLDLLIAMINNPVITKKLLKTITDREHLIFNEFKEEELEEVYELALIFERKL